MNNIQRQNLLLTVTSVLAPGEVLEFPDLVFPVSERKIPTFDKCIKLLDIYELCNIWMLRHNEDAH